MWVLLVAAIVLAVVILQPRDEGYDLDSAESGGYRAVRLLLEAFGTRVDRIDADDVDAESVARFPVVYVPVAIGAEPSQVERWRRYVESGGSLVLGTPTPGLGAPVPEPDEVGNPYDEGLGPSFVVGASDPGTCDINELDDLEAIDVPFSGMQFDADVAESCFGDGYFASVVRFDEGEGSVVNLATPDLFVNSAMGAPEKGDTESRDLPDNGAVAVRLLGRGGTVGIVTSGVSTQARIGASGRTWTDYLSPAVRLGLWQLVVAAGVYAWFRGRRHGRLVPESQAVTIDGSDFVGAVGNLLERQANADRVAEIIRRDARVRLASRFGVPRIAPIADLAAVVAARTGRTIDSVVAALGSGPVSNDAELSALSAQLDAIQQEAQHV